MDVARPYSALVPTLDGDVLTVLARTTRPLTGREISRLAPRGSWTGVRNVLLRLSEQGIVNQQEAGTALLYTLNRDHIFAPAILLITRAYEELRDRIKKNIQAWSLPAESVALFGSTARHDGNVYSDIDLLIIRHDDISPDAIEWQRQIHALGERITRWTGNQASISVTSHTELIHTKQRNASIIDELSRDAITITGVDIHLLISQI